LSDAEGDLDVACVVGRPGLFSRRRHIRHAWARRGLLC
jgi:hypothetical protein